MVPPPKRLVREDTPITATAAPDQSYSLANYSYRQGDDEKVEEDGLKESPKAQGINWVSERPKTVTQKSPERQPVK